MEGCSQCDFCSMLPSTERGARIRDPSASASIVFEDIVCFLFFFYLRICKSYTVHRADYIFCSLPFTDIPWIQATLMKRSGTDFLYVTDMLIPLVENLFWLFCNVCQVTKNRCAKFALLQFLRVQTRVHVHILSLCRVPLNLVQCLWCSERHGPFKHFLRC